MHVDLQSAESSEPYRSRVCIAGAGIAGILLASSLAKKGIEVHLLEGGGLNFEESSQELYNVQIAGRSHSGAIAGRFRTFGGSSTRWGGQILPYTGDVFHPPPGVDLPCWPLQPEEIEPFYEAVQNVFEVSKCSFTDSMLSAFGHRLPFVSEDVRLRFSKWAPFSRRNMACTLGQECIQNRKVRVFSHANVVSLELAKNGRALDKVVAVNNRGHRFHFSADTFVLCLGTIETSRLLLASTSVASRGVGNDHDQVGRYFHDHIGVEMAEVAGEDRAKVIDRFAPYISGRTLHTPKLEATQTLREKEQLLSVMAHFPIEEPDDSGPSRIRSMLQALQRKQLDREFYQNLLRAPQASAEIVQLLWAAKAKRRRQLSKRARISLHIDCEQRPQAESRVRLGSERDRLGVPVCVVDWKISQDEHRTVSRFAKTVDALLGDMGITGLKWHPEIGEDGDCWLRYATDTFHMMGGTRMGNDPASSVVDRNLHVHGIENLYIAGCSTFPTGGSSNPTFTMMALTLRLKDRIAAL